MYVAEYMCPLMNVVEHGHIIKNPAEIEYSVEIYHTETDCKNQKWFFAIEFFEVIGDLNVHGIYFPCTYPDAQNYILLSIYK
jgi:hypothetical protein